MDGQWLEEVRPSLVKMPRRIYVNGIDNSPERALQTARLLAEADYAPVRTLYNGTEGRMGDLGEVLSLKAGLGENTVVDALASVLLDSVRAGRSEYIVGHSQGALIVANALKQVKDQLEADGLSEAEQLARLNVLQVETWASAAASFPDGPQYVHYIAVEDLVPKLLSGYRHLGAGAVICRFKHRSVKGSHLEVTYMKHRVLFAAARRGQFPPGWTRAGFTDQAPASEVRDSFDRDEDVRVLSLLGQPGLRALRRLIPLKAANAAGSATPRPNSD
jgi:hypothetical protein